MKPEKAPVQPRREAPPLDPRLDPRRMPRHIAIIMDGNGRWAERLGLTRAEGHEAGARGVRQAIEGCREMGLRALTLYAFSTENWRRSKFEVNTLFRLMSKYIRREVDEIHANGIRVRFLGEMDRLPERAAKDLRYCLDLTAGNTGMDVCVALNYGSRAEIARAARMLCEDAADGRIRPEEVDEAAVAARLYVPEHAEVDLLIRTSGEMRISNFLLWQISYAEIVVTPTLWPDFDKAALCDAIAEYQARNRRFGGRP
ncbi:MAG: di-trans,poly-cis-decaprenylcistransferase [Candidatus Hydrogenedens sp.]|nr:di-trans,poly-cis-decaprenylcistransferase [Candidatus Hydrogenedens sp.]